jgi:hypothetical protein
MQVLKKEKGELGKEVNAKWKVLNQYNTEIKEYNE